MASRVGRRLGLPECGLLSLNRVFAQRKICGEGIADPQREGAGAQIASIGISGVRAIRIVPAARCQRHNNSEGLRGRNGQRTEPAIQRLASLFPRVPMADKQGALNASELKIAIVVARFNQFVTDRLLNGALNVFQRHGGEPAAVDVIHVPGAFELPLAANRLASSGRYDALVALAAVIRGATPHFDYVCSAASVGLSRAAQGTGVPIAFGVLTTDTLEQAIDRAGGKAGNKGTEAMTTAIEMANLLKALDSTSHE